MRRHRQRLGAATAEASSGRGKRELRAAPSSTIEANARPVVYGRLVHILAEDRVA